jgi:ABC-2 type transport system ATP-binding protein
VKVEIRDLRKEFGRTVALDSISFAFDSGHVFGFVGPNGAGKTTTMRIIATLDEPTSGDVTINGSSLREEPEVARSLVGYVPDSLPAHGDITVHEYLDFFGRAYHLSGRRLREAVGAVEDFTNLSGLRDKLIKHLSKGMKQRVSLARALIHDPHVLILDEPAAGLDPRARVELRELLGLLAGRDKAILISSHILTELTEICNGVVIIERGRVLETGTIEEVLKRRSPRRTVALRALDAPALIQKHLLEMPHADHVREVAGEIHVDIDGTDAEASQLLAELVSRGVRIVEFRQTREDLEDIFMKVTGGGVQ